MPNATQNDGTQPIAGCQPVLGLAAQYDRRWLVVDDAGVWLSPQQNPRLADIRVSSLYGYLVLRAPGMLRMDIPLDVLEDDDSVAGTAMVGNTPIPIVDEGDLLATWLSNFLQRPCRLVKRHPLDASLTWPDTVPPKAA